MHILQLHLFGIIVRSVGIFYEYNSIDIITFPPEHTPEWQKSWCTDETCYLSDCASNNIQYLYCFKGKFRVRVCVDG